MLKRYTLLALIAVLAPALAGCDSNDDDDGNGNPNNAGTLTATADGSSFQPELVTLTLQSGVFNVTAITNLDGSDGATQRQIGLTVPNAAAGTYNFPSFVGVTATYADTDIAADPNSVYTAISGQIEIEEISDSSARGTFSYTARNNNGDTVEITNGQFDVSN